MLFPTLLSFWSSKTHGTEYTGNKSQEILKGHLNLIQKRDFDSTEWVATLHATDTSNTSEFQRWVSKICIHPAVEMQTSLRE